MKKLDDVNVKSSVALPSPRYLKSKLPVTESVSTTVATGRDEIVEIITGTTDRLLLLVGPCSIHDPVGAIDYARRLLVLRERYADRLCIIMRVYFEKPRTNLGWKGLIYDPDLDASDRMDEGLRIGRETMLKINDIGMPCATEFLEPIIPQYISDLVAWAAIGARTTESQTHREMASGLSMPVGFKNRTDGDLAAAINAMISAENAHTFVGMNQDGVTALYKTKGNPWTHLVLRGGKDRPNYDEVSIEQCCEAMDAAAVQKRILVDCSHANSGKKPDRQALVLRSVINQRNFGNASIFGAMLESNLIGGRQDVTDSTKLVYGQSITDACLSWDDTEALIAEAANGSRR